MIPAFRTRTFRTLIACLLALPLMTGCVLLRPQGDASPPEESDLGGESVAVASPAAVAAADSRTAPRSRALAAPPPVTTHPPEENTASPLSVRPPVVTRGDISYENATITEDVTWSGSVLVRGYVVIASPATVRIEPGTVVRFMKSPLLSQAPRLVVMGRLHCNGAAGRPVLFTSNVGEAERGDWGGILLLSSEKRNQFDHVRIEGAMAGIEASFSTLSATELSITRSTAALLLRDSGARLARVTVADCETGLEALDSEVDLQESSLVNNRRAITGRRSTLVLLSVSLRENEQSGITAVECRVRLSSCWLVKNGGGAHLAESEGQVVGTRFVANRGVGLDLVATRLKVQGNLFADTSGDGMRVSDGRSLIWGNSFEGNSGYNLALTGHDRVIAVGNWWGSARERSIVKKLLDAAKDPRSGLIVVFPWLPEKPAELP